MFKLLEAHLTSLAWIAMSLSGNEMQRFHMCVRKSDMTVPMVQSSSVPWLVAVMRLTGMASMVDRSAALKMSWSFFLSLTRLCCGVRKMWGMNRAIHAGKGITKLFCSSLFMVFMTASSFLAIKGLFQCFQ